MSDSLQVNGDDTPAQLLQPLALRSYEVLSETIGGMKYRGSVQIVASLHVTYQQKTNVFGYIAPTVGFTGRGTGFTYGAGGSIGSKSESVVSVVYCDSEGRESTVELPSSISARERTILRLDYVNGNLIAATNVSGQQGARVLMSAWSFIADISWHWFFTLTLIVGFFCALNHQFGWAVLCACPAALHIFRKMKLNRERAALTEYMQLVMA